MPQHTKLLPGKKFGKLTLIKLLEGTPSKGKWECLCDCGETCTRSSVSFYASSKKPNCGCLDQERFKTRIKRASLLKDKEMIGKRFGHLIVKQRVRDNRKSSQPIYLCKCDCGQTSRVQKYHLLKGRIKTCGGCKYCKNAYIKDTDLVGQKFGYITVLEKQPKNKFLCRCDCGNYLFKSRMTLIRLKRAGDKLWISCGCKTGKQIEFDGKVQNVSRWAQDLGISRQALSLRLKKMPLEKALSLLKQL